jgi:hypothetical protein
MATLIFNSCIDDVAKNNIDFGVDTFYLMITNGFPGSKSGQTKRSDITNEITASGTYSAGGGAITATLVKNDGDNTITVTFGNKVWSGVTGVYDGGVIYKYRGGAAAADELVAYIDFGSSASVTNGVLTVTFTSPLTFSNPN